MSFSQRSVKEVKPLKPLSCPFAAKWMPSPRKMHVYLLRNTFVLLFFVFPRYKLTQFKCYSWTKVGAFLSSDTTIDCNYHLLMSINASSCKMLPTASGAVVADFFSWLRSRNGGFSVSGKCRGRYASKYLINKHLHVLQKFWANMPDKPR